MKAIAIIPAKGSSTRLPGKNILPFRGKPMLLWTCEAARDSKCFERVIVSSEDEKILEIADKAGFETCKRSPELSRDPAGCVDVCLEVVKNLEDSGEYFDTLCCLYATAPLRDAKDIIAVMDMLRASQETNAVQAVCGYSHSPYQMLYENKFSYLEPLLPLMSNLQSGLLPEPLIGNGSTYAIRMDVLKKYHSFYVPFLKGYRMSKIRSLDIDTKEDYEFLLLLGKLIENGVELK